MRILPCRHRGRLSLLWIAVKVGSEEVSDRREGEVFGRGLIAALDMDFKGVFAGAIFAILLRN